MPKNSQIDAPISLGNFFPEDSDSNKDDESKEDDSFDQCYETQTVNISGEILLVRQYAFHSHNANQVWPGTFNLIDFLLKKNEEVIEQHNYDASGKSLKNGYSKNWGSVLELGTGTGLLAIRLALACASTNGDEIEGNNNFTYACTDIVTSDVDDEGEVESNVEYNFILNNFVSEIDELDEQKKGVKPHHIPHTWGTGWNLSSEKRGLSERKYNTIVASDILLYISAYTSLVESLSELFDTSADKSPVFVMSWNRRMKGSGAFFEKMEEAGFSYKHEGNCVYTFSKEV